MKKKNTTFLIISILGIIFCLSSLAADNKKPSSQTISDSSYFREDSTTGKVKQPDQNYYNALENLNLNQSDKGLEVEALTDGSERVNLQGRFMQHSAILTKSGKVRYICLDHAKELHNIKSTKSRAVK